MLTLFVIGYLQSKNCGASGNQFFVYWFAPPLIGLVVGVSLPDRLWVKIVCAIGAGIGALIIAFVVSLSGDQAGYCGNF